MKRFRKLASIVLALTIIVAMNASLACTVTAAGKDATADGSVMVSHTCDGWYDHRIQIIEGGTHAAGEMVDIYRDPCADTKNTPELVGQIPQVESTYTYFHIGYPFMNDQGLVISEFTWSGRDEVFSSSGLFVIANLEILALQRAATAREAVQVMGALAEQYGYCDGGECLLVADKNEVWIFEICGGGMLWTPESGDPGAHWAARRVPDDKVFAGANRSRIGVIDFDDPDNYMWSTGLTDLPEEMGWWKQGEEFNFTQLFNPEPYGYPFYASRREWRVFSLLAPSQDFPVIDRYDHYDFAITPDKKITPQNIMDIYSDHLEGTDYDLTTDAASGPFGNPNRFAVPGSMKPEGMSGEDWEREIAQYRCSYSFVAQCRDWLPEEIGTLMWFGEDSPDTTVYVPMYCSVTEVPEAWTMGDRKNFDPDSAWWAFNFVNNYANLNWNAMYPLIREQKAAYESKFFADQESVEAQALELYNSDPASAVKFLTDYTNNAMNTVEEGWWSLAGQLVGHFYDGMQINEDGSSTNLGYPTEWLSEVGFGQTSVRDQAMLSGEPLETPAPSEEPAPTAAPTAAPTVAPQAPQSSNTALVGALIVMAIIAVGCVCAAVYFFNKSKKS